MNLSMFALTSGFLKWWNLFWRRHRVEILDCIEKTQVITVAEDTLHSMEV